MAEWHKGIPLTEEHKQKISKALKGKKRKPHTLEVRKKIAESQKLYRKLHFIP